MRSFSRRSCASEVSARKACPCRKQVIGFANSVGTRMTSAALSRVQSRMSGVTETEQMRIKAVSIASSNQVGSALLRSFVRRAVTRNSVCPTIFLDINKQYPGQYPWYLYSIRAQAVGLN